LQIQYLTPTFSAAPALDVEVMVKCIGSDRTDNLPARPLVKACLDQIVDQCW
jgi:hypothetical protein